MTKLQPSKPNKWISPPGATISDMLDEASLNQVQLAQRLGVTAKHVNELISCAAPISAELSVSLARVLGSTAEFWMNREANYRAARASQRADEILTADIEWSKGFPFNEMAKRGWVAPTKDRIARVETTLRFFGVASVAAYQLTYANDAVQFRKSHTRTSANEPVVAWLRRSELQAAALQCAARAPTKDVIVELRSLTVLDPALHIEKARAVCAAHGIALVIEPSLPGCKLWGASRWLTPTKPMIALSLRYQTDDHFWFTLFHEIGHVLLHSKKQLFLDGGEQALDLEAQADEFAADHLLSRRATKQLKSLAHTFAAIEEFAHANTIAPGIVVGRMQHLGVLPRNKLNSLKKTVRIKLI
jgi:HTH-type transcriptional regulator / antitoxin HigA